MPKYVSVPGRQSIGSLIVHSHLRWDFVWQRPQQLMSRFAVTRAVLFVEEPVYLDDLGSNLLSITTPHANIWRVVPHLAGALRSNFDASLLAIKELLLRELASGGGLESRFPNPVQWFITPMPSQAMLGAFNEIGVVYDCMDELSQFRHAPADLTGREQLLMSNADIVFTGGHKLFESKSRQHPNVHFFGCGVDVAHFGKARRAETVIPADASFDAPVAGYFGVIDERLDYDLIAALADQLPHLQIVMVGPVVKVSPDELPRPTNIHWLGQRSYDSLPAYVKGFDVCLMPFALNAATEYINPTKTLEYMAAGKPVVSTAVADVVRNFAPIVTVAHTAQEFVLSVIEAVKGSDHRRIANGIAMASASSWESVTSQMSALVSEAVDQSVIIETSPAGFGGAVVTSADVAAS